MNRGAGHSEMTNEVGEASTPAPRVLGWSGKVINARSVRSQPSRGTRGEGIKSGMAGWQLSPRRGWAWLAHCTLHSLAHGT